MKVGVLSDTHGLLRPEIFEVFSGVDCILHAGDIGREEILTDLAQIAPVHAVFGNVDLFPLVERLPEQRILELEGVAVFLTHMGGSPAEMRARYPALSSARVVIFGHSHRPSQVEDQGVLFLNPGSAGPRRFSLPVTVGTLILSRESIAAEIIPLSKDTR